MFTAEQKNAEYNMIKLSRCTNIYVTSEIAWFFFGLLSSFTNFDVEQQCRQSIAYGK